jgi:DNA-binding transcriptional LysR family regulator
MQKLFPSMDTLSWDDLRILLAVHRTGSLLTAGKALGLSTSTTGRRLDALEAAAGCRLVSRSQAGTQLEPSAMPLVRLAEDLEHGLHAERRDRGDSRGTIKVSVPDGLVPEVTKALLAFRLEHPNIDIELWGENRLVDLAKREADIGLRLSRSTSNLVVEKQVATLHFGLYASADYVRRHLPSHRLQQGEAGRHAFVGLDEKWKDLPHERWMRALGAERFPFRSTSIFGILEAVRQGVGIAALVEHDARNADLVRIEASGPGPVQPLFLVYHHELRKVPHIRAALAAIETYCRRTSFER